MSTNDPRDEAILALAGAIRRSNTNRDAIEMADRAEAIVRSAQCAQKHAAQLAEAALERARVERIEEAHQWMKKHMPASVSNFGGSDGVFGWTGTDAAGNRITWKVEPTKAASKSIKATSKQLADTMAAFAELAPSLTAAAEKRFAADPFAPTFGLLPGEDAITIELRPRPGSVQYLINVTGPHSSAVKIVDGIPMLTRVSNVQEVQEDTETTSVAKPGFWTRAVGAPGAIWVGEGPPPVAEAGAAAHNAGATADPIVAELRKINEFFTHLRWLSDSSLAPFR